MAEGPYNKFEQSFEEFQTQLRSDLKEELSAFKVEIIEEIRKLATGEPFDPLVFRHDLLKDIEQKFTEFKEELALALEGSSVVSALPNNPQNNPTPKKSSWLDKKIF